MGHYDPEDFKHLDGAVAWQDLAPPTPKDKRIPMTEEYFYKVLAMNEELIFEMKDEISRLKMKINKLEMKKNK